MHTVQLVATTYKVGADTGRLGTIAADAYPVEFFDADGSLVARVHYRLCRTLRQSIDSTGSAVVSFIVGDPIR